MVTKKAAEPVTPESEPRDEGRALPENTPESYGGTVPPPLPLVVLISRVMEDVGAVGKDGFANLGAGGKFNFRGVDGVVNAVSPALRRHGIVVTTKVESIEYGTVERSGGSLANTVHLTVTYTLHGPAGDSLASTVAAESFDNGDKGTAKAMSVAYRTFWLQALVLPTDEADPDEEGYERAPAPRSGAARLGNAVSKARSAGTTSTPTAGQKQRMSELCEEIGVTGAELIREALNRDVSGWDDLTSDEAKVVIDSYTRG